ncbi:MAG: hypothetical protein F4060_09010 [Holophagales bacterium]|nr:hypothetical protein [Holophagales bacterium]MYG29412.1 hypothetical protein [Holophagales bacterium]MYI80070.1 hypothetical protein [Holophagales bacterium]
MTERGRTFPRGLVLGLTMAEIAILIIFVLLLAVAALLAREADRRQAAERELVRFEQIEALFEAQALPEDPAALGAVLRERVDDHRDADNWRELVREIETTPGELREMAEAMNAAVQRGMSPAEVRDAIESRQVGGGSDHPSCWYDRDGTVAYLFDVALVARGFVLDLARAPQHEAERALLPLDLVLTGSVVSQAQFLRQTRPVYEWSVERGCRFFVRAFDVTAADQKDVYKRRMGALESRFYKNANPTGGLPPGLRAAR